MKLIVAILFILLPAYTYATEHTLDEISSRFIGTPYLIDSLGEGSESSFDTDPLIRFDKFDCQTFVETVLAIKLSKTDDSIKENMIKIRYKNNVISFENRNHFIEYDWIKNNESKGILTDITTETFDSKLIQQFSATLSYKTFIESKKYKLNLNKFRPLVVAKLETISIYDAVLHNQLEKIPNESILLITRKNYFNKKFKTKLIVTHMGLVIKKDNRLIFRHADRRKGVKDNLLKDYLFKNYGLNKSIGVSILKLNQN